MSPFLFTVVSVTVAAASAVKVATAYQAVCGLAQHAMEAAVAAVAVALAAGVSVALAAATAPAT